MPYLRLRAPSGWLSSPKPPVFVSSEPTWTAVKVGRNSRFRLVDSPFSPSTRPICDMNVLPRSTGDQTTVSFLPPIERTTWNPQR